MMQLNNIFHWIPHLSNRMPPVSNTFCLISFLEINFKLSSNALSTPVKPQLSSKLLLKHFEYSNGNGFWVQCKTKPADGL